MPRIIVHPEYLRNVSAQCQRQSSELQAIVSRVSGALAGLDWQVRESAGIENNWNRARALANSLMEQADTLARYLTTKAQEFEEADHASAASVGQVLSAFTAQQGTDSVWRSLQIRQVLPQLSPVQFLLDLGGRVADIPTIVVAPLFGLTGLIGGVLVGFRFLRPQPMTWKKPLEDAASAQRIEKGGLERAIESGFARARAQTKPAILDQQFKLSDGRAILARDLDGHTPLAGMDSAYGKPGQFPLDAPITSVPNQRHPDLTNAVINQFGVENNPRYARDTNYTYCNTFAGDYARAMGAPLPTKAEMGIKDDPATIAAQPLNDWLIHRGSERGWRAIDPSNPDGLGALVEHVNAGKPALASDPGHVAVIRPNQSNVSSVADLRIAQAGARNLNDVRLGDAGLNSTFKPRYFIHD